MRLKSTPTRQDFRHLCHLRVRKTEVDSHDKLLHGLYLSHLDGTAMAHYWRASALPLEAAMARLGGDLYLRRSTLEYLAYASLDDALDVGVRCSRIGNSSMQFVAGIFRAEQLLISGELVYVYAGASTPQAPAKARSVPDALRALLHDGEAGLPMVSVRVGTWAELGHDAQALRAEVFVQEQQIPADLEWDDADASCVHAVAYHRLGMPLATGRLLEHVPGTAKIGRMAVTAAMRGTGVGRQVLEALMQAARERGDHEVLLHAQQSAAGFYLRAGFRSRGPEFEEAGILHVEMVSPL